MDRASYAKRATCRIETFWARSPLSSNFAFLHKQFSVLENFGALAEWYCHDASNSSIIKLGMLGETIVNLIFEYDRIALPQDNSAATRIILLFRKGLLPGDIAEAFRDEPARMSHLKKYRAMGH